jgi:hypothetical protein
VLLDAAAVVSACSDEVSAIPRDDCHDAAVDDLGSSDDISSIEAPLAWLELRARPVSSGAASVDSSCGHVVLVRVSSVVHAVVEPVALPVLLDSNVGVCTADAVSSIPLDAGHDAAVDAVAGSCEAVLVIQAPSA